MPEEGTFDAYRTCQMSYTEAIVQKKMEGVLPKEHDMRYDMAANILYVEHGTSEAAIERARRVIQNHNKGLYDAGDEISEEIEFGDFLCIEGPNETSPAVIGAYHAIVDAILDRRS